MMKREDWIKIFLPMWIAMVATLLAGETIDSITAFIIITVVIVVTFVICIWRFSEKKPLELTTGVNLENGTVSVVYHFKNKTRNRIWVSYHVIRVVQGGMLRISKGFERSWVLEPHREVQVFESDRKTPEKWNIKERGMYHFFSDVTYRHDGVSEIITSDCRLQWEIGS